MWKVDSGFLNRELTLAVGEIVKTRDDIGILDPLQPCAVLAVAVNFVVSCRSYCDMWRGQVGKAFQEVCLNGNQLREKDSAPGSSVRQVS